MLLLKAGRQTGLRQKEKFKTKKNVSENRESCDAVKLTFFGLKAKHEVTDEY